jgi:phosphoglycolate phosphatase
MDVLVPGTLPVIKKAQRLFDKIILITLRRNDNALRSQLERLGIANFFNPILCGFNDSIPPWQMKVDLFHSIGITMDCERIDGYFIGDTEVDILAGKDLGLKTVAVTSGIRSRKMIEQYKPDLIASNFSSFIASLSINPLKSMQQMT